MSEMPKPTQEDNASLEDAVLEDALGPSRGPYQLLPPLAPEELAQLEASIRAHGIEDPISVDDDGTTLDGHHRREIADRLSIAYETRIVTGLSDDEKRLFAIRRNTERRQLTKAQRALVGMRAEPAFRVQAKARQGARTDLSPDPAKSRRVWAAEEAARLVGLPLSTFKAYRELIIKARRERGDSEVDGAIESGLWDIGHLREVATAQERREAAKRHDANRKILFPTAEELEEEAKKAWDTHGLLGQKTEARQPEDDEFWQCPNCEAYWSQAITTCRRCDVPQPVPRDPMESSPQGAVDQFKAEPNTRTHTVPADPLPMLRAAPYVPPLRRLKVEDTNRLHDLRRQRIDWFVNADPRELAPLVVAEWSPRSVTDLRDGIRVLTGWLTALDTALSAARLGEATLTETVADDASGSPVGAPIPDDA